MRFGFALALLCLVVSGSSAYFIVLRLNENAARIEHSYQVMNVLDALLGAVSETQIGGRRFVTLHHPENLDRYQQGLKSIQGSVPVARRLTAYDAAQQQRLNSIERLLSGYLADLSSAVSVAQTRGGDAAQRIDPANGRRLYDEFRRQVSGMKAAEASILHDRQAQGSQAAVAAEAIIIVGGLLAIGMAGMALIAIRKQYAARSLAEESLRRAKTDLELSIDERTRELRGIVDSSDDAIITKTLDGVITSWNPAAEQIFGYSAQQAIGQSLQFIMPDDRRDEEPAILARLARGERVDHFETVRVRADGSRIDISATISPLIDSSGRIIGASKIARDITERRSHDRKAQAQLERLYLLQQITRAIGERQDIKSIYQVVTRSLEENMPVDFAYIAPYDAASETLYLAALATQNEILTRELAEHTGRDLRSGISRDLVYEPDIAESELELPALLSRAGLRALVLTPLAVADRVFAVLITARFKASSFTSTDCEFLRQLSEHLALASHQAELHTSLQVAYDDLRQTQQAVMQQERLRALGQMASGVAHDINNALSPPALYIQILLQHEKALSHEARDYLHIIKRSLEDVSNTIARLRMFCGAREHERALTAVDLNQLMEQIAETTRPRWSTMPLEHGPVINLQRELAPLLPPIEGDESEIRDALTNLVFNAVDAMPRGGTLTLRSQVLLPSAAASKLEHHGERVSIEVCDDGAGMTEAVRSRCLEPFFTSKGQRGSGLGLAMVYGMAQRHGAELEIDSEPGVGTTMRLIFPAAVMSSVIEGRSAVLHAPDPRRILIIDDDPLVLKALREALEGDGHTVVAADGGRRGIEEFTTAHNQAEPFAAVFTDLGMPTIDGRFVAQSIKALAPEVPVILLTGWGQRLVDANDVSRHIDRILSKPPKLIELRAALAELVRRTGS